MNRLCKDENSISEIGQKMSQLEAACSVDLMEYLVDLLQPLLDEKGLVVWYDRDGALEQPLKRPRTQGWSSLPPLGLGTPSRRGSRSRPSSKATAFSGRTSENGSSICPGSAAIPHGTKTSNSSGERSRRRLPRSSPRSTIFRLCRSPP